METTLTRINHAVDMIEEFYRRCSAKFGDPFTPEITAASIAWIRLQSDAWPYGEPNLFQSMALLAQEYVDEGCEGVFKNREKEELLLAFGFTQAEVDEFNRAFEEIRSLTLEIMEKG